MSAPAMHLAETVPTTRAADGLPRRAFTLRDLETMMEVGLVGLDERLELIGGEIVPMSPKGIRHESLRAALNLVWGRVCPDSHLVARTGLTLSDVTYLDPDFIIFERSVLLANVRGRDLLLAVEVADSSLDYDLGRKPQIYAEHGVRELWVIDAAARTVHVHTGPGAGGYAIVRAYRASDRLEPTAAPLAFALALDDLPPV